MLDDTLLETAPAYTDYHVPRFEVRARGRSLAVGVLRDVTQVTYNDAIGELSSFDITVNNWDADKREFKYVGAEKSLAAMSAEQRLFNPYGGDFELLLGYADKLTSMTRGYTTGLAPHFPAGGAPTLTVRMLNALHRLRTRKQQQAFENKTISEIAEEIGGANNPDGSRRFPLTVRTSAAARRTEPRLRSLTQQTQYDIDFLLEQARLKDYEVYIGNDRHDGPAADDFLYFGPSTTGVKPLTLNWGLSLIAFEPTLSMANQVRSVQVNVQNRDTNRKVRARADAADAGINNDLVALLEGPGFPAREEILVASRHHTPEETLRQAESALSARLKRMVEATGISVGLPELRAGRRVRIAGIGARFSGEYFVTRSTHTFNDSGYMTQFTARREAPLAGGAA